MVLELYGFDASPPLRLVKFTLEHLGLEYEYKFVDIAKGEHKTPEFTKVK